VNYTRVRAHIFVSGRVQGVFFRTETKYKANELGVTGWIQNLPDGRVEAVLEGEEKTVKEIIEFCKQGPPGTKVSNVDVIWESYSGEFRNFEIRYRYRS